MEMKNSNNDFWENSIFRSATYNRYGNGTNEVEDFLAYAKATLVMVMILLGMHILKMGWQLFGQKCCKCKNTEEKI